MHHDRTGISRMRQHQALYGPIISASFALDVGAKEKIKCESQERVDSLPVGHTTVVRPR